MVAYLNGQRGEHMASAFAFAFVFAFPHSLPDPCSTN